MASPSLSGFSHDGYTLPKHKRVCVACGGPARLSGPDAKGLFFDTFHLDGDGDWRVWHSQCMLARRAA